MSGGARELNIPISGNSAGFDAAAFRAESRLKSFEQTLRSYERQWNAAQAENERRLRTTEQSERQVANLQMQAQREDAERTAELQAKKAEAIQSAGKIILATSTAVAAGLAYSGKAAIGWQSDFAGVKKTVDGTPEQLAEVEEGLRALTKVLPASHSEIAGVAEAAGQLGVATEDVVDFTRVMLDLGETTNLSSTDAATALAKISNIMGTASQDVSRMGSTIVDLGNNSATTEADIVTFSTRLAAAGKQAGLSEADLFAYSAALSSVGVEAEAGGTAMSKVFTAIADATRDGGQELEIFASVAGTSSADFKRAFQRDAAGTIAEFIEGMGRIAASGQSTTQVFEDLELTDQRLKRAILSTGSAQGLLKSQLDRANFAWNDNTALVKEAEQRYETAEAKIQIAKNSLQDTAITLGETFLPMVAGAAEGVADLGTWIGNLPDPLLKAAAAVGGAVSGLGILTGSAILLIPKIQATHAALKALEGTKWAKIGTGAMGLGKALGIATTAFIAFQVASAIAGTGLDDMPGVSELTAELLNLRDAGKETAPDLEVTKNQIEEMFTVFGSAGADIRGLDDALEALSYGPALKVGDWLGSFGGIFDSNASLAAAAMEKFDSALTSLAQSGDADGVAASLDYFNEKAAEAGLSTEDAMQHLPQYQEHLASVEVEQRLAGKSADDLAESFEEVDPAVLEAAAALEEAEKALQKWRDGVAESVGSFTSLVGSYGDVISDRRAWAEEQADAANEANRKWAASQEEVTEVAQVTWEDYYDGVTVSLDAWIAKLEEQSEAQEKWAENLTDLSSRVNTDLPEGMRDAANRMIDELIDAGPDGAAAVAALKDASDEELQKFVELGYIRGGEVAGEMITAIESHRPAQFAVDIDTAPAEETFESLIRRIEDARPTVQVGDKEVLDFFAMGKAATIEKALAVVGLDLPGAGSTKPATIAVPGGGSRGLASGGKVPGTPPANPSVDNVLAMTPDGAPLMVRSGEWIVNQEQSTKQDQVLRAINDGVDVQSIIAALAPGFTGGGRASAGYADTVAAGSRASALVSRAASSPAVAGLAGGGRAPGTPVAGGAMTVGVAPAQVITVPVTSTYERMEPINYYGTVNFGGDPAEARRQARSRRSFNETRPV